MTKLSVNINKIATLRNSRGGNTPNVIEAAINAEHFGAQGITVHPRPDARHIRYDDVRELKKVLTTELNIEGNPIASFIDLVMEVRPAQVTLVPDAEDAITSNAGWDARTHKDFLTKVVAMFKSAGIRTSIFLDPDPEMVRHAADTGTDRIELYTEGFAREYALANALEDSNAVRKACEAAVAPYLATAQEAVKYGLGVNAGHDLSLENLGYFSSVIPNLLEVSIGHALISDALYLGLENTIRLYRRALQTKSEKDDLSY